MKTEIFTIEELLAFGFKKQGQGELDNDDYYTWYSFRKNYSDITITYEYDKNEKFISGHVDFNCETLKGRTITKKDIQTLIEIM